MNRRVIKLIGILLIFILAFGFFFTLGIPCIFNKLTGYYCAGCGMTRAAISLCKFDFYQAFRYNALSIFILPLLLISFITELYSEITGRKNLFLSENSKWFWILLCLVVVTYGIIRNIGCFSWLSPTIV